MGILDWFKGRPPVYPTPLATVQDFEEQVENTDLPVILEVWSDTCPPCRRMVPVLEHVATRYADQVRVVTVGTAAEPALHQRLGVRATPTLIIFDGGRELGRMVGFRPEGWFDEMIRAEFPAVAR